MVGSFGSIGNFRVGSGNVEAGSRPTAIGAFCFGDRERSLFIVSGVMTGACLRFNIFGLVNPALGEIVGNDDFAAGSDVAVCVAIGEGNIGDGVVVVEDNAVAALEVGVEEASVDAGVLLEATDLVSSFGAVVVVDFVDGVFIAEVIFGVVALEALSLEAASLGAVLV